MRSNDWLKSGILLGVVFFLAVFLVKPIGVSTEFSVLGGIIQNSVDNNVVVETINGKTTYQSSNPYYNKSAGAIAKSIAEPLNYGSLFVLGIPLGSAIGYLLFKNKRSSEYNPVSIVKHDYTRQFVSGFLLLFGARMADGCTSGHMMSGMMQSSVSGYLFAAAVFIIAIPVAMLTDRR